MDVHRMRRVHRASWPRTSSRVSEGCEGVEKTDADRCRSRCSAIHAASASTSGWGRSPSVSKLGLGFGSLAEAAVLQGRLGLPAARSATFVADEFRGAESSLNEGGHSSLPRHPWRAAERPPARPSG